VYHSVLHGLSTDRRILSFSLTLVLVISNFLRGRLYALVTGSRVLGFSPKSCFNPLCENSGVPVYRRVLRFSGSCKSAFKILLIFKSQCIPDCLFFYPNKKWISFQFLKSMLEAKAFWLFTLVFILRQKLSVYAVRVFDLLPSLFSRGHSRPLRIRPMGAPEAPSGIPRVHPHHRGPGERVRRSGRLADRRRARGEAEGPRGPRIDCLSCVYVHRVSPRKWKYPPTTKVFSLVPPPFPDSCIPY